MEHINRQFQSKIRKEIDFFQKIDLIFMLLDLPKIGESITVKVTGKVEIKTRKGKEGKEENNYVCPCIIWCDKRRKPERYGNLFGLKLNGLWSLFETYQQLEEFVGEEYKLDKDLLRIVGDILTIKCTEEVKDNDTNKILGNYIIEIREDLKEIDKIGSPEEIINAKKNDYHNGSKCVDRNMMKVDEEWMAWKRGVSKTGGIIKLRS